MKRLFKYLLGASLILSISNTLASPISWKEKQSVRAFIDQLLVSQKSYRQVHMGILVRSVDTGEVIYQDNPNHLLVPASVQKLLTGISALSYLGPNFYFETSLLTDDGSIKNGVLNGNLTVKFSGDPTLRSQDIYELFNKLANLGVHQIKGSIFLDNEDYNNIPYGPGWLQDDFNHPYAAPLNAIIINENAFSIRLSPSKRLNGYVDISTNLPANAAYFKNNVITKPGRRGCGFSINSDQRNHYAFSGCVAKEWGIQSRLLPIKDPDTYAKALIKQALRQSHIVFNGTVRMHHDPNTTQVLVDHFSPPLEVVVTKMMKKSNNMIANTLLKKMGQLYFNKTGSWANGAAAVKAILSEKAHMDFSRVQIVDGSGLSRKNLISPEQLSQLLDYAYHDPKVAPYLMQALPLAGVDGTLRYRMKTGPHLPIRGKTGTMKSISGLAGYITTAHHHTLSFVIMINGYSGHCWPYTRLEDRICEYLAHSV